MNNKEYGKFIGEQIVKQLALKGKTQTQLADYLGVSLSAVNGWCKGTRTPKMPTIDGICNFLNIQRSKLIGDGYTNSENKVDNYYLDEKARIYANELKNNKQLMLLFDASRDAKKEDLQLVYNMLLELKKRDWDK